MRDLKRLAERGHRPNPWDFLISVAVWPIYLFNKRIRRPFAPRRWPADAEKIALSAQKIEFSERPAQARLHGGDAGADVLGVALTVRGDRLLLAPEARRDRWRECRG